MDPKEFGARIKGRREALGLSQNDVAMALQIPQGKISMIENGTRRVELLKELPALAEVLRCPIGWFYGYENLTTDEVSVKSLLAMWTPDVQYSEEELQRLSGVVESVIKGYFSPQELKSGKRKNV